MIVLLGASGYIGQAFQSVLRERAAEFIPLSRKTVDYTRFDTWLSFLRETKPEFVINVAGCSGKPNIDACENAKAETLAGNTLLPHLLAEASVATNIPFGHVSTGCIYSGAKVATNGQSYIEPDLMKMAIKSLLTSSPEKFCGFTEDDPPNFSFQNPPVSFYSGCKALGDEAIAGVGQNYIWRLRLPFDQFDDPRNLLTKVQRYPKVYDNVNSMTQRFDFARACLDLWNRRAPFGIYNLTNPGFVSTRQVIEKILQILKPGKTFEYWTEEDFQKFGVKSPRSNCVLDVSKLLSTGVKMRPVEEAIEDSLNNWRTK